MSSVNALNLEPIPILLLISAFHGPLASPIFREHEFRSPDSTNHQGKLEENLEDIPLVFEVPVNTDEDVLAMTQNDDNTNQEREESDSLNLVLESDTEAEEDEQNPRNLGDKEEEQYQHS